MRSGRLRLLLCLVTAAPVYTVFWNRNREMEVPLLSDAEGSLYPVDVREALSGAINKGAPMFNRGDIEGCAKLYKETAQSILSSASEAEKQRLSRGLQEARSMSSAKDAAWALRHAFDDVLDGCLGRRDERLKDKGTEREKARKGASSKDVHESIRDAISLGVPLYNSGDPAACAQVYEVCLRDIEPELDPEAGASVRTVLRQLPSFASDDKRAWSLRYTLDSILDGTCGARSGAQHDLLVDFSLESEVNAWKSVNDGVMGGRSTGGMTKGFENGESCAVFEGVLSTQNNGGFSSVRGPSRSVYDLAAFRGLAITFLGDDRQYKLTIKTDTRFDSPMYQADFIGDGDANRGWVTKELPWSSFKPSWRGRLVDSAPRLTGKGVTSLGIMISFLTDSGAKYSGFRTGAFRLAVKCIKPF